MITVNKYSVHSRLIALENFMTESLRAGTAGEIIALRAQVVALQSTVDALLAQNKKGSKRRDTGRSHGHEGLFAGEARTRVFSIVRGAPADSTRLCEGDQMSRQLSQDEMLAGRAEVPADSGTLAPAAVIQCFDRGLSTPAEKELGIATLRKHQHMFAPQSQPVVANDYMSKPNRWNGPRGVADKDLTVSERKCIDN